MGYREAGILMMCVAAAAGCARSNAQSCGDLTCPQGRICAVGRCIDESIGMACARLAEGASCTLPEIGTGTCQSGLCVVGSCGDGMVNGIEACDGDNFAGKTCLDHGATGEKGMRCTPDCSLDLSRCVQYCGDGVKNTIEECDGKDFGKADCATYGFYLGQLECTADCKVNTASCRERCGDGQKNGLEPCDGADLANETCASRGYGGAAVMPLTCSASCAFAATSCTCGGELCPASKIDKTKKQSCVLVDNFPTCVDP